MKKYTLKAIKVTQRSMTLKNNQNRMFDSV